MDNNRINRKLLIAISLYFGGNESNANKLKSGTVWGKISGLADGGLADGEIYVSFFCRLANPAYFAGKDCHVY